MARLHQSNEEPKFCDPFLCEVYDVFSRRKRALRQYGRIAINYDPVTPPTWFTLFHEGMSNPDVALLLNSTQHGDVILYGARGRKIFALRGLALVRNGQAIIEAFEWTMNRALFMRRASVESKEREALIQRWRNLAFRIAWD